jgi:hypothetical protein
MHGYFNLLLTDNCQFKTYYSQEKKCEAQPYFPLLLSIMKKKRNGWEGIERISTKNKEKQTKE